MRAHVAALTAALEAAGLTVHFVDAGTTPTLPYVLLWTGSGRPVAEASVAEVGDFTDTVGVTSVAASPLLVLDVQARARTALAPFSTGSSAVTGRRVWLTRYDSRPVQADRAATFSTGHAAYGVDMYDLVSVPA